jgi:transaldolase/glucose-6-phosphate isomerase
MRDHTLWSPEWVDEVIDRLGWLTLPEAMEPELGDLARFADEVRGAGIRHAVVLGMGGSSLAPEVFQRVFGNAPGYPELTVLDSTHPAAVRAVAERLDPGKTIFVVSSKSGTTTEPLAFFRAFWERTARAVGDPASTSSPSPTPAPRSPPSAATTTSAASSSPRPTSAAATRPSPRSAWCRRR